MRIVVGLVVGLVSVVGCRSVEAPPARQPAAVSVASLVGTTWVAEDIDERGVIERVQSTLTFGSPQRISGRAACNQYFGSLEQQEGTVRFRPAGATRMACAPAVMDQEQRFLSALGAVTTVRFDAGKLLLIDERGRVRVRLAPFPPGSGASVPMPFQAHAFDCGGGLCAP